MMPRAGISAPANQEVVLGLTGVHQRGDDRAFFQRRRGFAPLERSFALTTAVAAGAQAPAATADTAGAERRSGIESNSIRSAPL